MCEKCVFNGNKYDIAAKITWLGLHRLFKKSY